MKGGCQKVPRKLPRSMPFWGGTVSFSSSPGHATQEDKFLFFLPCFFPPLPPTCSVRAKTRRHPPYDEKAKKSCPTSDAPISHLSRCRDRTGKLCAPCVTMGWGRVDPAPPTPINTVPKGEEKKRKERRNRERERHIVFCERKGRTKGRKHQVFF